MNNQLNPKGLTLTIIFEAESANYGESVGNVASLKKVARNKGEQFTYISRQALRYNIVEQLSEPLAEVNAEGKGDKKVIQFSKDATIDKYPEIDFFGYLKTEAKSSGKKRSAKVRLSNAISLETFKGDLDFLTNKGLADRLSENMNIAQAEIHKSLYRYTITADLDQIGIDEVYNIEIENTEKARRVGKLLDTVALLYRDIRGRREDLKPLFVIGGVYDIKNPFFSSVVEVNDGKIEVEAITDLLYGNIKDQTHCAIVKGKFINENEVIEKLNAVKMPEFFSAIKEEVKDYYESH
ncbi:MAG: type I-B CRISPR-associated protein Cas7/Cst2/DevR [Peptoniphilus sp.]|uniref:CRISPR-associated autoregulator DevR family protein n=2 Tax=Peptoniphilus indolicus TaxID=33030 RepID=G4D312_9FIRM|nr:MULTISPECIES: type I-B CRISPR-associated protein Cas7/Cst2/DevR [Peptoniphilus]EGY80082.1 CRISPR-associated autoregulator DevR family protein [Peptoniphilus indolicus ATCC 29427]MDY2987922.1 type I-B CRISPR-associated protein Cas7/Cst2/DevR [Peptoniphilus sp.]SUB75126.1 CRISPR-associated protein Cas7/Cst2/DevR, subtype I-B/TNEAP [Peptoniphilus indolicus]